MGLFKKLFGICETKVPSDPGCWKVEGGRLEVLLDRAPELHGKNSAIRLEGNGLPERVLVVHGADGEFHAFRNRCSHGGRRMDPLAGKSSIRCCSVGQSVFDYEGNRQSGSAKKEIRAFETRTDVDRLIVNLD